MKYIPTAKAIAVPRNWKMPDGTRVGLGGSITIRRTPPKLGQIIPEATPEQYKAAFEAGFTHLVQPDSNDLQSNKSHTGGTKGSSKDAGDLP